MKIMKKYTKPVMEITSYEAEKIMLGTSGNEQLKINAYTIGGEKGIIF